MGVRRYVPVELIYESEYAPPRPFFPLAPFINRDALEAASLPSSGEGCAMTAGASTVVQLGVLTGGSALLGGILGFAEKKLIKVIALLVGFECGLSLYLEYQGLIEIHWHALGDALTTAGTSIRQLPTWLLAEGASVPIGAGFVGGFLISFNKA